MEWYNFIKITDSEMNISDYELIKNKLKSVNINDLTIDELRNAFECCVNMLEQNFNETDEVSLFVIFLFFFISFNFYALCLFYLTEN